MAKIDDKRFRKKMELAQSQADMIFPKLIEDAATFMNLKLVDSILNGMSGKNYPKQYPGGVSEGASGFVGVVTSNLRRSIGIEKVNKFEARIRQIQTTLAPYHDEIIAWSKEKYGLNFYEIAIRLYGPRVTREIFDTIKQIARDVDLLKKSGYQNPF